MIEKTLQTHTAMAGLFDMLQGLVSEAERTYCASGKAEDKMRLDKLLQSRAAHVESMVRFGEAGGADIVPATNAPPAAPLNANSEAL